MIYQLLRQLIRLVTHLFFRRIEVSGLENIPSEGALIFFGNHPNSLLDPALIIANAERSLAFAANDQLFQSRLLSVVMRNLGAVPVRRHMDHPDGRLDNHSAFAQLDAHLVGGGAIGIFPEGLSHDLPSLAELKTGAARIAVGVARRNKVSISLIPCGLHYIRRRRFRSGALIQFGEPLCLEADPHSWSEAGLIGEEAAALISATAPSENLSEQERVAARALTARMERSLRALTVNGESWETISLLDMIRRLYQPRRVSLEERALLAQRFSEHWPSVQHLPAVNQLAGEVATYQERLSLLGLRDGELVRNLSAAALAWRGLRHILLILLWLPLTLLGAPVHFPLALILAQISQRLAPRKDAIASAKLLGGLLTFGLLYLLTGLVVAHHWGWRAGMVAVFLLPMSGLATLKAFERGRFLSRLGRQIIFCLRAPETLRALRRERRRLREEIQALVDQLAPPELERIFPMKHSSQGSEEEVR